MLSTSHLSATVFTVRPADFKPQVEVAACFLENGDRILLLHRREEKSEGNTWGIPGGKLDKGETALYAAIREVKEETGFTLSPAEIAHSGTVYIKANETFHYVYHMFRASYQGPLAAVTLSNSEHKGFTWVTPRDALNMDLMQDEDTCILLTYPSTTAI